MIEFLNVVKKYPNGAVAVNDISFTVNDGEIVFIHGRTDSGKTTLRKLMLIEEKMTSGNIYFDNIPLSGISDRNVYKHRRKIGVIFRESRLFVNKTVYENIAFALRALECPEGEIPKRCAVLLKLVGLEGLEKKYPDTLTGAQRQRAEIARAMASNPKVIMADEPTASLDHEAGLDILNLLMSINERGKTVIIFTKDEELAKQYRKRMITLDFGKVVSDESAVVSESAEIRLPEASEQAEQ
ncbi:MAG: ATP-binding cassette domain-containing protein [Ruminococcaceae bacterium]|nr:ATP-binding cassette domain-containing protein [Oscillospiraceae bacterium]